MFAGSKYEIPEQVNENKLMTLGKDVEMQTFKTNVVPEEQAAMADKENKLVVILCVGQLRERKMCSSKIIFVVRRQRDLVYRLFAWISIWER